MHRGEEVRQVVVEWRTRLGMTGLACSRDARRLLDEIPELSLRWRIGQRGRLLMDRDSGRGWVTVDPGLSDREFELVLLEEIAHFLLAHLAPPAYTVRGQQHSNGKAETPAQMFICLWRMIGCEGWSDDDILAEGFGVDELGAFRRLQIAG